MADAVWSCGACTFFNEASSRECGACGTRRPSGAELAEARRRAQEIIEARSSISKARPSVTLIVIMQESKAPVEKPTMEKEAFGEGELPYGGDLQVRG